MPGIILGEVVASNWRRAPQPGARLQLPESRTLADLKPKRSASGSQQLAPVQGLKSNGAVASIALNMGPVDVPVVELPVPPAAADVAWVTVRAVIEYNTAVGLLPTSETGTVRVITPPVLDAE
jgi:hypothetical protein